jgi:hypothetical protein
VDLVHEDVVPKQGVTPIVSKVIAAYERYSPLAIVMDTGGPGKKIAEEISGRFRVPVEAADKQRKNEHIEWVNDALRTRRLFVPASSRFANDALKLEWDKTNIEKWKVSDRFHSDIADALLYAYVKALHWLHVPAAPPPAKFGTPEWYEEQAKAAQLREREELDKMLEEVRERRDAEQMAADALGLTEW